MNPLYRNDSPGRYPESWYVASSEVGPERPALEENISADIAVIGAGYTGLSTALHCARKGLSVVVIDAHRVGFGASGRNGGQAGSAWNKDQMWLEKRVGQKNARALWELTMEAKILTRELVAELAPDSFYKPGILHGAWSASEREELHAYSDWLAERYDFHTEKLDAESMWEICRSPVYCGGVLDMDGGHLHPLRYVLGMARGSEAAGAKIFERTEATAVEDGLVVTPKGQIAAKYIVLAGNGYLPNLSPDVSARVMPINSFIAATEPLGDQASEVLSRDIAVADDRFVVNYFRLSEDKRLLFGGRESYTLGFPTDILTALRKRMLRLFPQLENVRIDYHWGGTLGITMTRLPFIRRIGKTTIAAGGFSGHGVAITGLTGKIIAEAISGDASRFDLMSSLPASQFPGGRHARMPLLTLGMTWYSLRDRLGI